MSVKIGTPSTANATSFTKTSSNALADSLICPETEDMSNGKRQPDCRRRIAVEHRGERRVPHPCHLSVAGIIGVAFPLESHSDCVRPTRPAISRCEIRHPSAARSPTRPATFAAYCAKSCGSTLNTLGVRTGDDRGDDQVSGRTKLVNPVHQLREPLRGLIHPEAPCSRSLAPMWRRMTSGPAAVR